MKDNDLVLAIDTSTPYLSLALARHDIAFDYHQHVGHAHSNLILPEIQRLFEMAERKPRDLTHILLSKGPGGFTGLRIGAGVAHSLAYAARLPVHGIPTLDTLMWQASVQCKDEHAAFLVTVDARMNEVFWAYYEQGRCVSDYQVASMDAALAYANLAATKHQRTLYYVGNGFACPSSPVLDFIDVGVSAKVLLDLLRTGHYDAQPADEVDLLYVRNHVAKNLLEQAADREKASLHG
jgi:tRNA threonylcarbamoyladenosine biosynthesis protein TsaB